MNEVESRTQAGPACACVWARPVGHEISCPLSAATTDHPDSASDEREYAELQGLSRWLYDQGHPYYAERVDVAIGELKLLRAQVEAEVGPRTVRKLENLQGVIAAAQASNNDAVREASLVAGSLTRTQKEGDTP